MLLADLDHKTLPKKGVSLKGKNLLLREQILSFMSRPLLRRETEMKMAEFFFP